MLRMEGHVVMTRILLAKPMSLRLAVSLMFAGCSFSGIAHAQAVSDAAATVASNLRVWIEPRVSVGVALSSNGGLDSINPQSEQVLQVSPGVQVVMNTPRVRGSIDYSLTALHHAQGTSSDSVRHALNANANVNAWDNRLFVDVSGIVADQRISAFGAQTGGSLSDANRSQTSNYRFSPYLRGNLTGDADYELRYGVQSSRSDAGNRSDVTQQDMSLHLSDQGQRALGWTLDASAESTDYSLGRETRSDSVRGGLSYAVTPQLMLTLQAGRESNNVITFTRESYSTAGVNLDWRPSPRTRLNLGLEDRYFGRGHNISFEHRTGRTVWRITDSRGVVNSPLSSATASLGSISSLLDALYASVEPDPVKRAQRIQLELLQLGLPPDAQVFQNFLTSSATVNRAQMLSLALVGVRSVVTLSVNRSTVNRLDAIINLGDDLDNNTQVRRLGWSLTVAHRLTPLTSLSAALSSQKSDGSTSTALATRTTSASLGFSTRLGLRTTGSVEVRRTQQDGVVSGYGETAISGLVTHRF